MKCILSVLTGLILLAAPPALAAESSDQYADLEPVSQLYIQKVVERAKAGLNYAKSKGSGGNKPSGFLLTWSGWISASVLGLVDTDLRLTEQERSLLQNSPCLRIDALILEGWMERARLEKMKALDSGNSDTIYALVQLQRYLNDRFKALLLGAYDPTYQDKGEAKLYAFDPPPYYCCVKEEVPESQLEPEGGCAEISDEQQVDDCTTFGGSLHKRLSACKAAGCIAESDDEEEEPLCPYTTDYFPPTTAGYGCDTSILEKYEGKTPEEVKKEYEALQELVKDRDKYIQDAGALRSHVEAVSELLGLPRPDLENFQKGKSSERRHRTMSGCVLVEQQWPDGLAAFSARGPFSIQPADNVLLTRLNHLWTYWGSQRVPPDYLKFSWELDPGTNREKRKEQEETFFGLLYSPGMYSARDYLRKVSIVQLGETSFSIPKAYDTPQRFAELFGPLREQVSTFAESSQSNEKGMRGFARNLAFFLRRSCIFRPCNSALDRILKIVLEDSCFPYAAGLTEGGPEAAEDCKKNAKL